MCIFSEPAPSGAFARELGNLFGPTRSRSTSRARKMKSKQRTWTGKFLCLADKDSNSSPTVDEKIVLLKAGLGVKKIQFTTDDTEEKVRNVLMTHYPLLEICGGFELLRCGSNCRTLQIINGKWDVLNLRNIVGSQATIYVRPIQRSIEVHDSNMNGNNEIKDKCLKCQQEFNVFDLRQHVEDCVSDEPSNSEILTGTVVSEITPELRHGNEVHQQVIVAQEHVVSPSLNTSEYTLLEMLPSGNAYATSQSFEDNRVVFDQLWSNSLSGYVQEAAQTSGSSTVTVTAVSEQGKEQITCIDNIVKETCDFCVKNNIENPVEILRLYQKKIVCGRSLEVENEGDILTGETNFIVVDRNNILKTGFDEISGLSNLRLCLEVQFYDEVSRP